MSSQIEPIRENDVVLIYYQDKPAVYARIESIQPDIKRGWYVVNLLFLTLPAQNVSWILRDEYINGAPYTMGGQSMRMEKVKRVILEPNSANAPQSPEGNKSSNRPKVIPFKKPI